MPGRGVADVIFCLDSSSSMKPTFDAVRKHVVDFLEGLKSDGQTAWDVRFDFVSHAASQSGGGTVMRHQSLFEPRLWAALYGANSQSSRFFTRDLEEFRRGISALAAQGDEANFIALDFCLDLPWRMEADCHRIVVMLTDEPLETGLEVPEQREKTRALIDKIHGLGVKLFIVGPESSGYNELAMANGSEYEVVSRDAGLASSDLGRLLRQIGKSVSASRAQSVRAGVRRAIFGQDRWSPTSASTFGGE
ncbi:MAG: vWA domain-containing protein [Phycisphaerales bacterium]